MLRLLTLEEEPPGTFDICRVCVWEDDNVQFRDPDYEGGANRVSLRQARENYRLHEVSDPLFRSLKARPRPEASP